jgi:hypothetical protein
MAIPIAELFVTVGANVDSAISGLGSVGATVQKMGSSISGVGRDLTTAVTAPLVGLGALVVDTGADFEHAFTQVRKTVEATPEELETLRRQLIALSTATAGGGKTAADLAKVAAVGGQLGLATADLEAFTRVAAGMSVATGISADKIGEDIARIATLTGTKGPENMERLGSAVTNLGNKMGGTEGEILELGNRLAGALTVAGVPAQNVLAISSALAELGVNAEAGGTAISSFFSKMVAGSLATNAQGQVTAETSKKMQTLKDRVYDLGQSLELARRQQAGFTDKSNPITVERTADAIARYEREINQANEEMGVLRSATTGGNTKLQSFARVAGVTTQRFQEMVKADPSDAFRAIVAGLGRLKDTGGPEAVLGVLKEIGITDVRMRDAMLRLAGAEEVLDRAFAAANEGFEENTALNTEVTKAMEDTTNQFNLLKNELQAMAIEIWPTLKTAIFDVFNFVRGEVIPRIQELIGWWQALAPEMRQQILMWGGLAAALGPGLIILGAVVSAVGALLTPIGLVIVGVGLLAAAWINNWGDIQGKTAAVEADMLRLQGVMREFFFSTVEPGLQAADSAVLTFQQNLRTGLIGAFEQARTNAGPLFEQLRNGFLLASDLQRALSVLMLATYDRVLREMAQLWGTIFLPALQQVGAWIDENILAKIRMVGDKIVEIARQLNIPMELGTPIAEARTTIPAATVPTAGAEAAALGFARQAEAAALAQAERIAAGGPGGSTVNFNAPLLSNVAVTNEADEIRLARHTAEAIAASVARVEAPVPTGTPGLVPFA